ncbi:rhomboid family intramembrane serine protease [Desulfofustis limnaeus]|jgi:membrane associated rhomboid family serine protease|uniref:Peptidase S54 rhomboid domain-containing protein n=1 Tax=Desulfofustis limnaeus TaxID=2740163 RepID=A0ABN6LZQ2_9BACT|nr:rhomboid family intramembrane serine protease [Desulfofustis limnaeus]MDX9894635.1 rhomboid family intramembrane serine protease [Desulfofustis sp.]BDD86101.1 hypothetical protein DPPLL_04660 [Desulfofustis limnaeus]
MDQANQQTEDDVTVVSSSDHELIDSCTLVLTAVGIEHYTRTGADGSQAIVVPAAAAATAAGHLDKYFQENRYWPPAPATPATVTSQRPPTLMVVGALALFYLVTGPWQPESSWFAAGAGDGSAILHDDQWYRLVTALTLHADFAHLAGNCLIGGIVLHYFLQIHGTGLGLLAVLLSAAVGNYVNVQLHGGNHLFVGYSTAVFSTIGMLSAHQMRIRRPPFTARFILPLLAGAGLLAMLGSSGQRTDLGGHLFGLLAGIGVGLLLTTGPLPRLRESSFAQTVALLATISILLLCWNLALRPTAL